MVRMVLKPGIFDIWLPVFKKSILLMGRTSFNI